MLNSLSVEIEKMRIAGRLAAQVLDMITPYVKSGVSTDELDKICHDYILPIHTVRAPIIAITAAIANMTNLARPSILRLYIAL
jgi:methionine aminopeptidase